MKIEKQFDGYTLVLDDGGSGNERMLLRKNNPVDDYITKHFTIQKEDTVIDIGAHVGQFSVYAAVRCKDVFAYEPDPNNVIKFEENIRVNQLKNIHSFSVAVSSTKKPITLYLSDSSSENSMYENTRTSRSISVPSITLQDIFDDNNIGVCNFLKMDCEGAEYDILPTASSVVFRKIEKIALEYHDHLVSGKSLKDLVYLLSKRGFFIRVKRGAWYTGILYARKSKFVLMRNLIQVYVIDLSYFIFTLVIKKFRKLNSSKN